MKLILFICLIILPGISVASPEEKMLLDRLNQGYFNFDDIANIRLVCRSWKNYSDKFYFFKSLFKYYNTINNNYANL